ENADCYIRVVLKETVWKPLKYPYILKRIFGPVRSRNRVFGLFLFSTPRGGSVRAFLKARSGSDPDPSAFLSIARPRGSAPFCAPAKISLRRRLASSHFRRIAGGAAS